VLSGVAGVECDIDIGMVGVSIVNVRRSVIVTGQTVMMLWMIVVSIGVKMRRGPLARRGGQERTENDRDRPMHSHKLMRAPSAFQIPRDRRRRLESWGS
jgi:hypothetical protein